jgi:hypothetical protein
MEEMATTDYTQGQTFEQVSASVQELKESRKTSDERFNKMLDELKENREQWEDRWEKERKESNERWEKERKESNERFEKERKESNERFEKMLKGQRAGDKRLKKEVGKLGNRLGEMVEAGVIPRLIKKFDALGFKFAKQSPGSYEVRNSEDSIITEIDTYLENLDEVMIVEIKTTPTFNDVKDHEKRLDRMRAYADSKGDKLKYYGAIAGVVFRYDVREYALRHGFCLIVPSGNNYEAIGPTGNNRPRVW